MKINLSKKDAPADVKVDMCEELDGPDEVISPDEIIHPAPGNISVSQG